MSSLQQNWRRWQNRFCLKRGEWGGRGRRQGAEERNDPNNVCTYEQIFFKNHLLIPGRKQT
jgi:hypothetical protein